MWPFKQKPATVSAHASALAKAGAEQRRQSAKQMQDATTARLRAEIAAGYVSRIRERTARG